MKTIDEVMQEQKQIESLLIDYGFEKVVENITACSYSYIKIITYKKITLRVHIKMYNSTVNVNLLAFGLNLTWGVNNSDFLCKNGLELVLIDVLKLFDETLTTIINGFINEIKTNK